VTCGPISRQYLKYADKSHIASIVMQYAVNTTIEELVFSVWFAHIHCWSKDVFSMSPPRDYISSPVINQKSVGELRERMRMERVLGSQGRRVRLKIDCELF
jgi:hypothetical protein